MNKEKSSKATPATGAGAPVPPVALSTSFRAPDMGVRDLMAMLARLRVATVELEYRIHDTMLPALRDALRAEGIGVVSVHNVCPFPTRYAKHLKPDGDLFRLSSVDSDERALAVKWTTRTIELASELEAGRVVLHCGRVDMAPEVAALHRLFEAGAIGEPEAAALRERLNATRERLKGPHLDALMFSLEALLRPAEALGVRLGLENRYHHHELPGSDDFDGLFRVFDGAPVGYWHDLGHAKAVEALGFSAPGELLTRYGDRLVGIHVHDADGLDDHRPPGAGKIDFFPLRTINPAIPRVLELKPGTPEVDVAAGLDHLRQVFRSKTEH
ncbi:MAG: TIM barrel protein [Pseudomonadota bacterium]